LHWNTRRRLLNISLSLFLALWLVAGAVGVARAETYEVQPGETLFDIAQTLGIDPMLLSLANHITDPSLLRAGQSLVVPDPSLYVFPVNGAIMQVVGDDGIGDWVVPCDVPTGMVSVVLNYYRYESPATGPMDAITLSPYLRKLTVGHPTFLWPAFGQIATYFGEESTTLWKKGYHEGIDISTNYGSIVRAANDGVVVNAGADLDHGYGNMITLRHNYGLDTLYGHLSRICVFPGQQVKRGQVIGLVGNTGFSTGPHLHFGVIVKGQYVDPLPYLP
jgi:murein DD-endopeptidase MepM/ murein hydrolase activator NlpD